MHHAVCLCLSTQQLSLILIAPTHEGMARLSRPGCTEMFTRTKKVTDPSANRAQRNATSLITTNALPLSQTATEL